jgi:hypothetical protein
VTYKPESADAIELNLSTGPYSPESWDSIELDFAASDLLPWLVPSITRTYGAAFQTAGNKNRATLSVFGKASQADCNTAGAWNRATETDQVTTGAFEQTAAADHSAIGTWGTAGSANSNPHIYFNQAAQADGNMGALWGNAIAKDHIAYAVPFIVHSAYVDAQKNTPFYSTNLLGSIYDDADDQRALLNTDGANSLSLAAFWEPFTPTAWNDIALNFGWTKPDRPSVPHDVSVRVTARQATPRDNNHRLPWGLGDTIWRNWNLTYPVEENDNSSETEPPTAPEFKKVYLIMNSLSIKDVDTNTPLDVTNVGISLDIDSYCWTFTGTLYGEASLALVQPDSNGMKDITVTINGHTWIFSVYSYVSDEKFPTQKYTITGKSRTIYMTSPFAPTSTYTNLVATTAAQWASYVLQNTGFSLDWSTGTDADLPDWAIPAGALSYTDKTPAQIIAQIVTAAGGVMIPAMAADSWTIQPRYTVAPWNWDGITGDVQVYAGQIRSRAATYEPNQDYDSVYVSGIDQGVSVDVQITGSGGLNPMTDIYDDLITEQAAAVYRGRAELSAVGNKVSETLSVFLPENGAAPGVILPGQLIKVLHDDSASDYIGLVLSNNISASKAGAAAIYQSVTIERSA